MAQGTFSTGRAVKRDRYPDRADDTRRVRTVDADAWDADAWSEMALELLDMRGMERYASRMGRR